MDFECTGAIWEWRGPAPFHFVTVPTELCDDLRVQANLATYGWGVVPVTAESSGVAFTTSLFPRDGGYVIPIKAAVRQVLRVGIGDEVTVSFTVAFPQP
ncbi:MAG: DUF1905 domain-containing protein [Actinomycetes bacterium]